MRWISEPHSGLPTTFIDTLICAIDPITLTGLALAGLAGGGAAAATGALSGGGGAATPAPAPAPAPTPPPAAPATAPAGSSGGLKGSQPSFVGASATPSGDFGQKTLVGQ